MEIVGCVNRRIDRFEAISIFDLNKKSILEGHQ